MCTDGEEGGISGGGRIQRDGERSELVGQLAGRRSGGWIMGQAAIHQRSEPRRDVRAMVGEVRIRAMWAAQRFANTAARKQQ
jgi:hypothetical protein